MTDVEDAAAKVGLGNGAEPPGNEINLDAARKARREKQGPPPYVVFFGDRYDLPRALPAKVIDLIGAVTEGDYRQTTAAMRLLLGGPIYEKIEAKAEAEGDPLELDDVVFLLEQVLEKYGVTLPESKGSVRPS